MNVIIDTEKLEDAIRDILKQYGDVVYVATEEGLDAATDVLIESLTDSSPADTGKYKNSWGRKKKYKLKRYVGNSRMVKHEDREIPLSNILEYGENSPHKGLIKRSCDKNVERMAQAMADTIKRKL